MSTEERIDVGESKIKTKVYEEFKCSQKEWFEGSQGLLDEELQGW